MSLRLDLESWIFKNWKGIWSKRQICEFVSDSSACPVPQRIESRERGLCLKRGFNQKNKNRKRIFAGFVAEPKSTRAAEGGNFFKFCVFLFFKNCEFRSVCKFKTCERLKTIRLGSMLLLTPFKKIKFGGRSDLQMARWGRRRLANPRLVASRLVNSQVVKKKF